MARGDDRRSTSRRGTGTAAGNSSRGTTAGRARSAAASANRPWLLVGGVIAVLAVVVGGLFMASRSPADPGASTGGVSNGTVIEANGGHWTNISPDTLASMMTHKDFTLLNVKTPYVGEIQGTDLYIPYDQLTARASELPTDRTARIVVYCRTGHESAIAAQTLLDLGYTAIENLDGGMTAWTASGRPLVQLARG